MGRRARRGAGGGGGGGLWRVFVAIDLPDDLRAALHRVQRSLPVLRVPAPETLHLTLAFVGEQPPVRVEALHMALDRIRAAPFDLAVTGFGLFGGRRPTVAHAAITPAAGLLDLHGQVLRALRETGLPVPRQPYVPHVTLARLRHDMDPGLRARLDAALAAADPAAMPPLPVHGFALFRSTLSPEGARHDLLAAYPLRG